ncbi:MAG: hypothetical protein IPO27_12520 [Bacteroidetes bacterium]|nr:hypothetical protein [Bacteroidota bacterium]
MNSNWCFGDSAGINFVNTANPLSFASSVVSRGSCTSISDSNSVLQFYSYNGTTSFDDDTRVCNNTNDTVENGTRLNGRAFYNQILFVPTLDDTNLFYIFHSGVYTVKGFYFSILDKSANGGLGKIIVKNAPLIVNDWVGDCLIAIKSGNGKDWWIITKYSNDAGFTYINRFYVYLVSSTGISPPIIQDFGNATDRVLQKIYFNNQGNKLMNINITGLMTEYNFDRCTGILSNPNIIFPEQTSNIDRWFWEGAYSPNDSLFYVAKNWYSFPNDTSMLLQYNLFATDIPASCDTLWQIKYPVTIGAIRLAPDNKMYVTCAYDWGFPLIPYPDSVRNMYNENLGVINYPDSIGAACNFTPFSFNLGGKRTYWGLPNNPDYSLGRLLGSPCDTLQWVGTPETPKPPLGGFKSMRINPNPFASKINIELSDFKNESYVLKIVDAMGKEIWQQEIVKQKTEIDLEKIKQGFICYAEWVEMIYLQGKIIKM